MAESCAHCSAPVFTLTADGTPVCRSHDPDPSPKYPHPAATCTAKSGRCDQPLHPDSDEFCVLHI